ncbi:hypothetical protein, partial [Candidatus Hodarchaeum mangrovi]
MSGLHIRNCVTFSIPDLRDAFDGLTVPIQRGEKLARNITEILNNPSIECQYFDTSAKDNRNVKKLYETLCDNIFRYAANQYLNNRVQNKGLKIIYEHYYQEEEILQ